MQLLDTNHILVRYASEEVATLQANEPNAQPALLVVYNMVTAKILAAYDNASTQLLTHFENFSDFFRNARMSTDCQYMCSPSNNIYARYISVDMYIYACTRACIIHVSDVKQCLSKNILF
jgi:de-etiolated-1